MKRSSVEGIGELWCSSMVATPKGKREKEKKEEEERKKEKKKQKKKKEEMKKQRKTQKNKKIEREGKIEVKHHFPCHPIPSFSKILLLGMVCLCNKWL